MDEIKLPTSGQNNKEILPDAIIIHSNGLVRFINPAGMRLFGFSSTDEVIGKDVYSFILPENLEIVQERIRQIETEEIFQSPLKEMNLLHRNGHVLNTEVTAVCAHYMGAPAVMTIVKDISARKGEEEERLRRRMAEVEISLRQAEDKSANAERISNGLAVILDSIAEGVAMYDASGKVLWANALQIKLMGGDITGLTWKDWKSKFQQMSFRYPDGWIVTQEEYPAVRALRGETFGDEVLFFNSLNNRNMIISVSGMPIFEDGNITGAIIVMRDITEQEQQASRIKAAFQSSTDIIESINDGFLSIDHKWHIIYANRRVKKTLGLSGDNIENICIWDKFPKLFDSPIGENLRRAMEEKKSLRFEFNSKLTDRCYIATVYTMAHGISVYIIDVTKREAKNLQ